MRKKNHAVSLAASFLGGQVQLAKRLGVTPQLVSLWCLGKAKITAERAVEIEKACSGIVKREDIRPDLFIK